MKTVGVHAVYLSSAKEEKNIEKFAQDCCEGKTTAIAGPSGVGKVFNYQYFTARGQYGDRQVSVERLSEESIRQDIQNCF